MGFFFEPRADFGDMSVEVPELKTTLYRSNALLGHYRAIRATSPRKGHRVGRLETSHRTKLFSYPTFPQGAFSLGQYAVARKKTGAKIDGC
jgi:hypothetical protein